MKDALVIDRHAFASNASSFDTAWQTFGWSPGLGRARASRLEEQVPWATLAARSEAPARLTGSLAGVLAPANFDDLQWAFLPLDGRYGFAVWGAIGDRRNGEWRVLTHTLLFDDTAFDVMGGFPQGLLTVPAYAAWFAEMVERTSFAAPAPLAPVRLERTRATRRAFEDARRAEVARLRGRLLDLLGGEDRLEAELAGLLESLAQVRTGGRIRHVALRSTADRRSEMLVRLAWTSLPLADRAETHFLTEQRRTEAPRASLLVLPDAEWGQYVPEATKLLEIGRARGDHATRGRQQWARSVARGTHDALAARVESRRWRVVARDDLSAVDAFADWRDRWTAADDRRDLATELLAMEARGQIRAAGRIRAAAHVAALAFAGRADTAAALLAAFRAHPAVAAVLVRSAVRTLGRGDAGSRAQALLLRCHAALEPGLVPTTDLFRLFEREAPLVVEAARDADAARALFLAAFTAGCAGHAAADGLIAAALPGLEASADEIAAAMAARDPADPRVARVLAQCIRHGLRLNTDLAGLAAALLERFRGRPVPADLVDPVLRLLWLERRATGRTAAADFALAAGEDAWPVLLPLLVAPAPLPLFLELRRVLAETRAPRATAVAPWLAALAEYCPSLHEQLRAGVQPTQV
jgi:hypothetical protein